MASAANLNDGQPDGFKEFLSALRRVLFVPRGSNPAVLREATRRPILTIGEEPDFLDRGGIIHLRLVGSRLRFDINAVQAQRVGLTLSAQLLRLAQSVRGGRP